ncbi:uncharacterized protein V6R79_008117 [Siganus canaliculatus]
MCCLWIGLFMSLLFAASSSSVSGVSVNCTLTHEAEPVTVNCTISTTNPSCMGFLNRWISSQGDVCSSEGYKCEWDSRTYTSLTISKGVDKTENYTVTIMTSCGRGIGSIQVPANRPELGKIASSAPEQSRVILCAASLFIILAMLLFGVALNACGLPGCIKKKGLPDPTAAPHSAALL